MAQVEATGFCERPIRLAGRISERDRSSGEIRVVYDTNREPDTVAYLPCGSRLASKCVPCSSRYWRDAFELVAAGLRGGKGVPETVGTHPTLFATFTAPSFGHVHSRRLTPSGKPRTCFPRERWGEATCSHGRPTCCYRTHGPDNEQLGQPLCPDCFDYEAAVLWNALSTQLWKRTPTRIRRELARLLGLKVKEFESLVRLEYVKVAETQRRGLIHFHALIRLDDAILHSDGLGAPAESFTVDLLEQAVYAAVRSLKIYGPRRGGRRVSVGWGPQVDLQRVATPSGSALTAEMAAGYLAKYATKEPELLAGLPHRIDHERQIDLVAVNDHIKRLMRMVWRMADDPDVDLNLRRWAHQLGFRGHWLTKSRRYSTRFTALRQERATWRAQQQHGGVLLDAWGRLHDEEAVERLGEWRFVGAGYRNHADAMLATTAGRTAREAREIAKEELRVLAA